MLMNMTQAERMNTTSPITASQSANCLLVSIYSLGLAVGVPLELSSSETWAKIRMLGLGVRVKCAETREVLRDCAQVIGEFHRGTTAQNVYAAVNQQVVWTLAKGGTSTAI